MRKTSPYHPLTILLLAVLLLSGCDAVRLVTEIVPAAKIPAAYKPVDQTTVVFVDDPRHAAPTIQALGQIAERIVADLQKQKVITAFVPVSKLDELRLNTKEFNQWAIDRVGRELGARQVIYILIDTFDPAGRQEDFSRPSASVRLKVVDAETGRRLFPPRGEHGVTTTLNFKHELADRSTPGNQTAIVRHLADRLGRDIAYQFYEHEPRAVGSGFGD